MEKYLINKGFTQPRLFSNTLYVPISEEILRNNYVQRTVSTQLGGPSIDMTKNSEGRLYGLGFQISQYEFDYLEINYQFTVFPAPMVSRLLLSTRYRKSTGQILADGMESLEVPFSYRGQYTDKLDLRFLDIGPNYVVTINKRSAADPYDPNAMHEYQQTFSKQMFTRPFSALILPPQTKQIATKDVTFIFENQAL